MLFAQVVVVSLEQMVCPVPPVLQARLVHPVRPELPEPPVLPLTSLVEALRHTLGILCL